MNNVACPICGRTDGGHTPTKDDRKVIRKAAWRGFWRGFTDPFGVLAGKSRR